MTRLVLLFTLIAGAIGEYLKRGYTVFAVAIVVAQPLRPGEELGWVGQ